MSYATAVLLLSFRDAHAKARRIRRNQGLHYFIHCVYAPDRDARWHAKGEAMVMRLSEDCGASESEEAWTHEGPSGQG